MDTTTSTPHAGHHPRHRPSPGATPGSSPGMAAGMSSGASLDEAPFGLPVLAELPALAAVLTELTSADRALLRAVIQLCELLADDSVETTSGVSIAPWITLVVGYTRMDRRLLLRTCRLLGRFPALRDGVTTERLSWPQLRGLTLALRDVPTVLDPRLDAFLAALLPHLDGQEPDAVVRQVERAVAEWGQELAPTEAGVPTSFLYLQPRLDGTGGRVSGEFDAVGLAVIDEATAPARDQLDHLGGVAGARAENLLTRLSHSCDADDTGDTDDTGDADDPAIRRGGSTADTAAERPPERPSGRAHLPPVRLLLRMELGALLDETRTPADLLTRLTGGHLRLSSAAARRLVDERGAELRSIVVDDLGRVVGVGRATRVAPGWLRDASLAVHDTCTAAFCEHAARDADLDHAQPWWPSTPGQVPGGTDLDNLGPLCATSNRGKERAGWRVAQAEDGTRRWSHPRSGLTVSTVPGTWRPPGWDPTCAPIRHGAATQLGDTVPDDGDAGRRGAGGLPF
jgi:hypothetical protein